MSETPVESRSPSRSASMPLMKVAMAASRSADIDEAGMISSDPDMATFKEGTEVTLTAKRNFGYQFKEWQDADGQVLGKQVKQLKATVQRAHFQLSSSINSSTTYININWNISF